MIHRCKHKYEQIQVLLHFSLSVKAVTLIFISGRDLAISSTHEGKTGYINGKTENFNCLLRLNKYTRDVFYVRREVDLMKTAKLNAYIMHIFEKIELLSIYAA